MKIDYFENQTADKPPYSLLENKEELKESLRDDIFRNVRKILNNIPPNASSDLYSGLGKPRL